MTRPRSFPREELIRYFDLPGINPAPGQFSYDRLEWLNGYYIRQSKPDELAKLLLPFLQQAGLKADLETTAKHRAAHPGAHQNAGRGGGLGGFPFRRRERFGI